MSDAQTLAERGEDLSQVRAVVFDVDGTLYRQSPLRRAMAVRLARTHAFHPVRGRQALRVLGAYRRAQEDLRVDDHHGDLAEAQLLLTARRTGVDRDQVARCVEYWMEVAPLAVLPRVGRPALHETLGALRSCGLRLGVLSDYPAASKLQALGVGGLFDAVVCAQDPAVGRFKPDPRGLLVALERLGVTPDHALYVGDRPDVDATAAAAAGVRCAIVGVAGAPGAYWSITSLQELRDRREFQ